MTTSDARAGAAPAVRETHVGLVVLAGDRAYKVKKPVRTSFCDFSTVPLRRAALERELALNRRIAPDVYLGLGCFDGPDGAEPVLVMRRMPDERRLSELVRCGAATAGVLRGVARQVAAFHACALRGPAVEAEGSRDALAHRWRANTADLAAYRGTVLDPDTLDAVDTLSAEFLDGRSDLFASRRGRIVDGHGDLLCDDVFCLDDGPRLLDCLDFDDRLRYVDGLDDVAFLAMDLERLGAPEAAATLLAGYREFSGDPAPPSLQHHYVAYRAAVRAKVACLRHATGDPGASALATAHLDLTERHLRTGAVRLALVGGLPGTGKSTVGAALADRVGAVLLSSDRVRKETAGLDPAEPAGAPYGEGLYRPGRRAAVYDELLARAGRLLGRGESVVLDASWTRAADRARVARLADGAGARVVAVRCHVGAAEAARRIRTRGATASDADPTVAAAMARDADPWPQAVPVPTDGPVERAAAAAVDAWDAATVVSRPERARL